MEHPEALKASRQQKLVPPDKFDRHMAKARLQDINSRKQIFDDQTGISVARRQSRKQIKPSVY